MFHVLGIFDHFEFTQRQTTSDCQNEPVGWIFEGNASLFDEHLALGQKLHDVSIMVVLEMLRIMDIDIDNMRDDRH